MPSKSINQIVGELSFDKKLLAAGSLLMIVSAFLPWYQDLDSFRTGDMFLGISGPMYLAGFSLIALAALNLAFIYADYSGRKIPKLPVKKHVLFMFTGIFAFYALILVNSVYFHPKFGVNITLKQSQFGMFLSFISAALITFGGYLSMKDKAGILKEFRDETAEQLISVPAQERNPEKSIRKEIKEKQMPNEPVVSPEGIEQMQMENLTPAAEPVATATPVKHDSQIYRMDL